MNNVIYLSYDGMTDTLGESQVLAYVKGLVQKGWSIDIISFEKEHLFKTEQKRISSFCERHGIVWHPQVYHKQPPIVSTLWDIKKMLRVASLLIDQKEITHIHCRGYISGLVGNMIKQKYNIPYIFDMRGFWPDEKVESGAWRSKLFTPVYLYFKKLEKKLFNNADIIVSLTNSGKEEIVSQNWSIPNKIGVIPTCVNFESFPAFNKEVRISVRNQLGISNGERVLLYSGSLGGNYDMKIPFTIFEYFKKLYPESHFIILSRSNPEVVESFIEKKQFQSSNIHILTVPFPEVNRYLMAGDVGLIFYGRGYSNLGRSPTKLGEYWACGLPVLAMAGIGDLDSILKKYPGNGSLFQDLNEEKLTEIIQEFPYSASKEKMRLDAKDYYALDRGVEFYNHLYTRLSENNYGRK